MFKLVTLFDVGDRIMILGAFLMVTPEFILKVVDDVSDQNDQISHQKACHRYLKLVTNKFRIQQMLNTAVYKCLWK